MFLVKEKGCAQEPPKPDDSLWSLRVMELHKHCPDVLCMKLSKHITMVWHHSCGQEAQQR